MLLKHAASFIATPAAQILHLKEFGYVVIKRSPLQDLETLQQLNREVLDYAEVKCNSKKYKFWRYFNSVSTSDNRHSIPLPITDLTMRVLKESIGSIRTFLDYRLRDESPLIELSAIITYPGAQQQQLHCDTPYQPDNPLISGFVALSRITVENGPTCVLERTHTEEAHTKHVMPDLSTFYSVEGEEIMPIVPLDKCRSVLADIYLTKQALLDPGDMLIFNTNIFHYGSANTSVGTAGRALLCFGFQARDSTGQANQIKGFTYHTTSSMRDSKLSLSSFPAITQNE